MKNLPIKPAWYHRRFLTVTWCYWYTVLTLIVIGILMIQAAGPNAPSPLKQNIDPSTGGDSGSVSMTPGWWLLAIGIALGFLWVAWKYLKWFSRQVDAGYRALEPLPSPAEIAVSLEGALGRQPTIPEVAAAQQMLQHEKNQALIRSGVAIGAVFLIGRDRGGK